MARDKTAEEYVESHLHAAGVADSGDFAAAICETLREQGLLVENPAGVTPTQGAMDEKQHTAFLLRIMVYLIEIQPTKRLAVDLEHVMQMTSGRQMQVRMEGPIFEARTIPDVAPVKKNLLI